ncbi:MAG: HAMP domain-containing histidine kinase [Tagaea sp.]|nr:HAMP domain-containing histidine kinase [Tagaea sp.]
MTASPEAALDALAERLDQPVARLDAHHRVVFANAAFVRVFGTAPAAIAQLAADDATKASLVAALSAANEAELPLIDARGQLILTGVDSMPCGEGHVAVLRPKRADAAAEFFLTAASHELRTPLNAVLGFAQMIARGVGGAPSERHADYARSIETGAKLLIGIVDELLAVARDDAAADRLDEGAIDLAALARGQLDLIRPQAEAANVTLAFDSREDGLAISGDARKLAQATLCLLANAVRFSPPGGVVTLGLGRTVDGEIALWVSDQGPGIPPTDARALAEPLFRRDNAYTRRTPGTGLSLAIVRRYVEMHDGRLDIGAGAGGGACVTLRLPAARLLGAATAKRAGIS